jgi:uracil-DNA glycosylase family 4
VTEPDVGLAALDADIVECRACPRLVQWREEVARTKRASFAGQSYWGRPVPGFGAADARILVLGLAPAAHGANRTGRMFTGDRSGDWLYAALFRAGLASQPTSVSGDDGLELTATRVTAAVRCAPPANQPTTAERDACAHWLDAEFELLAHVNVVVALGGFAWTAALAMASRAGYPIPSPRPRFGHGARIALAAVARRLVVLGSYHPSQQNTFTGKLTEAMLDDVLRHARADAGLPPSGRRPGDDPGKTSA